MATGTRPRVVVVGAGFAGLATSRDLPTDLDVTVIDRGRWFEFLPNIHELVSGVKEPALLRLPCDELVSCHGHRFLRDTVTAIDPAGRAVVTERHGVLGYDALVLATGGENATHGVPGVTEHALPFKSVASCSRIRERLDGLSRTARRSRLVIVGGGLEGIEALGEILRRFRAAGCFDIHLVEAGGRLLGEAPAVLDGAVRDLAAPHGVQFHVGISVERVEPSLVRLVSGAPLPADAVIWTGGPAPPRLLAESGLAPSPGAWAPVTAALESPSHPGIFVAGDAADPPERVGKQAYHALDMGACVARNVRRRLAGREPERYRPAAKPMLISFGDLSCFLVAGRTVVAGAAISAAKEAVFQAVMARLDARGWSAAMAGGLARLSEAGRRLAWPVVSSPAALWRQLGVRVLATGLTDWSGDPT